ncbi:hypothetical protein SDC9_118211 [bioreactor metagenome]|uniref:Stage III sporulation protein AH n=1 Tax=bioreactor metagenome TaxID=1076179 RepID=A0A645C1N4_9ZZZZ|nr:SpoIIIAH-like family protein [Oscillospiraceae bacterium]
MEKLAKINRVPEYITEPEAEPALLTAPEETKEEESAEEPKRGFAETFRALIPKKRTIPKPFPWKSISAKNVLVVSCIALIAVAGYINIRYYLNDEPVDSLKTGDNPAVATGENPSDVASEDENYFTVAVINRQRVRDEAIDLLQTLMDSESTPAERRDEIMVEMNRIADEITYEVNIENLVRAKGINECVAVINDGNANIIVKSAGLTPAEIAQIKEIVYVQTGIVPKNIKIIEKSV